MGNQNKINKKNQTGFTLIELLVVIAIIALLSSVALIAFMSARQKSRDAKRLSDMVQMNNAMALYFSTYQGYPTVTSALVPTVASSLPQDPQPPDGGCELIDYHNSNASIPSSSSSTGANYYYYPSGTTYVGNNNTTVYPDYGYYFCIGNQTGNFPPGLHVSTPKGLR